MQAVFPGRYDLKATTVKVALPHQNLPLAVKANGIPVGTYVIRGPEEAPRYTDWIWEYHTLACVIVSGCSATRVNIKLLNTALMPKCGLAVSSLSLERVSGAARSPNKNV